jgi:hypothetical protein
MDFPAVHDRPISAVYADATHLYIAGDPNASDIFLRKLTLDGALVWEAEYDSVPILDYFVPSPGFGVSEGYRVYDWEFRLFVSSGGDVYVTGYYNLTLYQDGYESSLPYPLFFRKYNSSGVLQWERR